MTPTWKSFFSRLRAGGKPTNHQRSHVRRSFRTLTVESLEDRWLPTFWLQFSTDGGSVFSTPISDSGTGKISDVPISSFSVSATAENTVGTGLTTLQIQVSGDSDGAQDLVIQASVTGVNTAPAPQTLTPSFTGSILPSGGTATMETWIDNSNTLFGTTGPGIVADTGSISLNSTPSPITGIMATVPYSETTQISVNLTGGFFGTQSISLDNFNTLAASPVTVPTINTTQQPATATVGTSIADTATVSGGNNPTGTVTFNLYNNSTASGTPLFTDTEALSGGMATSANYTATATGTDYWVATYNGDSNNSSVTSTPTSEPVTITPATPAINTTQQPASATVGTSIADTATVSGGFSPTGTVTFNLYNNSTASGTPLFTDTEALSGGMATSAGYTATATGTDYWVATYNGDSNNVSVTSTPTSEPVTITPATPTINTTQQPATAIVGTSIADTATVSGGFSPTGTVTFNLYNNSTASGTPLFTDTEALSGGTATSAGYTATATGTDYWVATYNGDSNNSSVTSTPTSEPVTITPATPTINTTQQPATATVGTSIADTATVSGGFSPTGTVTFNLYNNSTASGTPLFTDTEALSGGMATSAGYTATATGTDYWVATYNGDSNNSSVTSTPTSEPVTITPATPTINTTQQPATATVGTSIADTATVSGGFSPTGTVTFNLYNNSTASGTPLFTDTEALSGGTATSAGYTATATGTDYWVATYNGDSNNSSVTSTPTSEPVTITPATPAINTTQQPASATVGTSIADTATVSGGFSPTGTVTFNLYNNSTASGTPLFTDTEALSGGTATSAGYTATATGTDYWVATYNGDSNNSSVTSTPTSEPVTITPATPTINTTQQPTTAIVGTSIADTATVSGGFSPTGTVTFNLYNNSTASGTPLFTDTEALSGGMATSAGYTATATGTDYWVATYNGDSNNSSVTSTPTSEPVTITPATPAINTTQQPASATVGTSIADTATVSGGFSPTGTVTFNLYNNSTASGTPLFTDTEALSGGTATSAGYTATATGTDYWVATYNGDSNNSSVTSTPTSEPVTITPATPTINTTQQPATAIVGTSIADTATVSGGFSPTGTVTFNLYNNSTASGTPLFTDTEALSGGMATSANYTATATGTDYWVATYNGDSNNSSVTSTPTSEPVTITPATPTINTTQQPATAIVGTSIADTATVSGGFSPTGTVTFNLYNNSTASGTPLFTDTEALSGGTATSAGYTATATGTDYWVATYNGDSNNSSVTSTPTSEPVTITPATPTINTTQQPTTAIVGTSIADTATVSGGFSPTGTVTFNLYNNSTASGTPLFTDTEALSGGTATSAGYTATATGTDYWVATYNGDSNNSSVTSTPTSEPVTITPATPAINTTQQPASATVGTSIADTATVSGGFSPTGTVTFNLYNNSTASGTPLFTDTEALSGGMATSAGYTATATGTDYWVATYNGDSNNSSVTSTPTSEPVTITPATPAINTTQQPASATVGTSIADTATVSGGFSPTGTVTFNLYNNSTASGTPLFTDTEALSGGTATSAGYTATATGTDYWVATYNGDSNNSSVTSTPTSEPVTITPATPTINTTQQPATAIVGTSIADTATVSGGFSPTGTVTFNLYNNSTASGTPLFTDTEALSGGMATSAGYTATATGTDYWVATYNGDSNNSSVTSTPTSEPVTITPATPTINTTQQPATAIVGTSIADTATVSGGFSPTGTVTFNLYNNSTESGTPLFTDTEALSGGMATSAGYTATATGTDYWVATYNGDSNNSSVTSTPTSEPVTITPATPTINTTQQPATAIVGTSIADTATVSGGFSPTGTVTFNLYNNSTASGTPLFTDANVPLTGGTATSTGYTATATGTDYWVATYNGDSNNSSVTSAPTSEPVKITPATPTINTTQQPATAIVGTSIADTATVSGGFSPTGTVTFNLYNNSTASGTPLFTDTEALSGGMATSAGYTATATGTDYWVATYNGNSNNSSVTSTPTSEPVKITSATPAIATQASLTSGGVCGTAQTSDTVTVTGGDDPTGTVTFTLTAPDGTTTTEGSITISGDGTYSGPKAVTATEVGTYTWLATYSGDSLNNGAVDNGTNESVTTGKASPTIATQASLTSGGVCGTAQTSDTVTVTGGDDPTGTITFTLKAPDGTTTTVGSITISGDGTYSGPKAVTVTEVGTYTWLATYSGDSLNNGAVDNGTNESVTTGKASPTIATQASLTSGGVCGTAQTSDTVTVTGGDDPTGTITFTLKAPDGTTTTVGSITISGDGTYSGPKAVTVTEVGTYTWLATYSGDSLNNGAVDNGTNESVTTGKASPTIATQASLTSGGVCGTAQTSDTVTVTGGDDPTGTITFTLKAPDGTTTTVGSITISGDGTYSGPKAVTVTEVGTYTWLATYSGDSLNNGAVDNGTNESVTTGKASPTIATQASITDGGMCNTAQTSDTVTVTGGDDPTGTITFTLKAPDGTTTTVGSITISGDGTYSGPKAVTVTEVGTYTWLATYSGDSLNNGAVDNGTNESVTTVAAGGTITGTKFLDLTGNGFSSDDTGLGGVTIDLYKQSNGTSGLQTGSGGDTLYATTTTASGTGNYSFGNLPAGTYYVQEVVPNGYIQTGGGPNGSAGDTYYTVNVQAGQTYSGNNFDDYQEPTCQPTCYSFAVNNNGCTTTVNDLRGNTQQGDTVTVTFTTGNMSDQLTLVSYTAPGSSFNSSNAYEQQIYDEASGTFAANKTYTLTVQIPNCYYQIDFICGPAINQLGPTNAGPDSSNIFYTAQNRLLSADNGGTEACSTSVCISNGDYASCAFWSSSTGQGLINCFNGSSNSTQLACWLATTFPNLYGANCGSHATISNGNYLTNAQVASNFCSKFSGGDQQTLATALSLYATCNELEGSSAATKAKNDGLHETSCGSGYDIYSVGSNGAAFGVANNTNLPVFELLQQINANTSPGASVCTGASTICSGITTAGKVNAVSTTTQGNAYTPADIRTAYGINDLSLDGTGQTIAIVDAYDDPAIYQSVDAFDSQFGTTANGETLYDQYGAASTFLTVVGQDGSSTLPSTDAAGPGVANWEMEEALDVEWAHAIAPGANIVLVEANSPALSDLMTAVATAGSLPNTSVVSMSWGFEEGVSIGAADEALYDTYLTTPAGHQGVTFVASSGDFGAAVPQYPALSPNVVAVGGTSLTLNGDGSYNSETGWGYESSGAGTFIGSGGGISQFEAEPAFQEGVQSTGFRTAPDVSFVADPATGVTIADTYNFSAGDPWVTVGGTSLAAPAWAGLLAIADEGRVNAGEATLGTNGPTEAQTALYSVSAGDYNAVTSGTNGYSAGAGYNLVTGLGTPVANLLVPDLVSYNGTPSSNPAGQQAISAADLTLNSSLFNSNVNSSTGGADAQMNGFAILNTMISSTSSSNGLYLAGIQDSQGGVSGPSSGNTVVTNQPNQLVATSTAPASNLPAFAATVGSPTAGSQLLSAPATPNLDSLAVENPALTQATSTMLSNGTAETGYTEFGSGLTSSTPTNESPAEGDDTFATPLLGGIWLG